MSKQVGKRLDFTDPKVCKENKEAFERLKAVLSACPPREKFLKDGVEVNTFEDAQGIAYLFKTLVGCSGFPEMRDVLADVAKTLSRSEVEVLLSSLAMEHSGKSFDEVVEVLCKRHDLDWSGSPIVPLVNVKQEELQFFFVNVSKRKCTIEVGRYDFHPITIAHQMGLLSFEGPVTCDVVQEFCVHVREDQETIPGRKTHHGKTSCRAIGAPIFAPNFPINKLWEGLVDIRVNMIVNGEEYEERAQLLFDVDSSGHPD